MAPATFNNAGTGPRCGFCTHFAQLCFLCALEVAAGSCLWWANSADFATLHRPKGRTFAWGKQLTVKGDNAETRRLLSKLEKPRKYGSYALLIMAGCYLGGTAVYTFSLARAHHRKHMVETKIEKLFDSWLVRLSLALYILFTSPALVLSAWLGYGVYFGPGVALKMFALSFEQSRRGVQLCITSATIMSIALVWRMVALCHDFHKHSQMKEAAHVAVTV